MPEHNSDAGTSPGMTLRIEVFPDDLDAFVNFYIREVSSGTAEVREAVAGALFTEERVLSLLRLVSLLE
jgi:hypothetical protein